MSRYNKMNGSSVLNTILPEPLDLKDLLRREGEQIVTAAASGMFLYKNAEQTENKNQITILCHTTGTDERKENNLSRR